MTEIIFGTEKLEMIAKHELMNLFDYLETEEYKFDIKKKVWHDGKTQLDTFHHIGLFCNEWGGVVVHVPVKAWYSFKNPSVSRGQINLNQILPILGKEFCGQTIMREGGINGKITKILTMVWKKI